MRLHPAEDAVIDQRSIAFSSFFSRDKNDPVGRPRSINGRGPRIFQNRDIIDIIRIEQVEISAYQSVDDHQGGIIAEGSDTPDIDIHRLPRLETGLLDRETGRGALHSLREIGSRPTLQGR